MNADENKTVGSSDGMFEDSESISLLFSKEGNLGRSRGGIGEVKNLFDVLTASSGEKVTLPRVPITVLLEGFEVGNIATYAFAESINSRGSRGRSGQRRWKDLDTVALEAIKIESEPGSGTRRRLCAEPGEERTKLLNLDDIKLLISSAILDEREEDGTIGRRIHGDEIGGIGHASSIEA